MCSWFTVRRLLGALVFLIASAEPASPHAFVDASVPADRSTVREAPREVTVRFTESVELEFSRITVKSGAGETVSTGPIRQPAGNTLTVGLKALGPGSYTIEWRVLSVDTHVTDGVLRFTIGSARSSR
jgi:methionine-rich copper-binding protein CopC